MTGAPPVSIRPALWAALSSMQIELPGSEGRFEERLAASLGSDLRFAERVTDEYRRFLYLAATADFEATPSQIVDEAWHLHLTLPHYREILCDRILMRPLDHRPGTATEADEARCARQYARTLALYERAFMSPAPRSVWPRPGELPEAGPGQPKTRMRSLGPLAAGAALAGLAAFAAGAPAFSLVLLVVAATLGFLCLPVRAGLGRSNGRQGNAGCGGSCGGGSADGGDGGGSGCCASCGGSCGGGGD